MSWTPDEKKRIQQLENALAKQAAALHNVASKKQLNQILAILTKENKELRDEIESLKARIAVLES